MASKICVPCDFGIDNMYDPFHGNVSIEFNDDTKLKVNSLILSWNSATFCYLFNELRLSNVEIKDFSKEAVIVFLESLYTGDLNLVKSLFREINKLSFVFKTKWLSDRCMEFFDQLCESVSDELEDFFYVFSEAMYAYNQLKNEDLIKIVIDRFCKIQNISSIFVERYLTENFSSINTETLDYLLLICVEDFVPVLKSLRHHLIEGDIDDTTRNLLSNPKIVECLTYNLEVYEEVYELLANKSGNMAGDDFQMLTNLNLCVIRAARSLWNTVSKQVVPVKDIPNLFHDRKVFEALSVLRIIERLSSMPNCSIFMAVELTVYLKTDVKDKVLQKIPQIFASKSICRVPTRFVQNVNANFRSYRRDYLTNLPQSVISEDDTAVVVGTNTTLVQLVTTSELYKFYFQHPAAPLCEKHTECGFMLKVTPCSRWETGKFNIELVTEESEYPADIHCHSEVISAAHMHLVVEWYFNGSLYNRDFSWAGKPEYSVKSGGVVWGGGLCNNSGVRLVVYYDIRDSS